MRTSFQILKVSSISLLAVGDNAVAGLAPGPVVSWGPLNISAVPTLGTWALVMLAMLLAIFALRAWRESPNILRSVVVLAMAGATAATAVWTGEVKSSAYVVQTNECRGSITVGSSTELENNCGETVVLSVGSCSTDRELICYNTAVECARSGDLLPNGSRVLLPNCVVPREN